MTIESSQVNRIGIATNDDSTIMSQASGGESIKLAGQMSFDVVVVGGGGAGLAAAIEARSLGRSVCILEKNLLLGGSTARSVGSITATNTSHQLERGILDSPDDHFLDMEILCARKGAPDNTALRRILVDNVSDTFRWLQSLGVVFYGPLTEPPHRKPRMHNVLPNSGAYIFHLERHARRIGVKLQIRTRVCELLFEGDRVIGVLAEREDGLVRILAEGGVILATGDFGGDRDLRAAYMPHEVTAAQPVNPTNTGDGHKMVLAIGGQMLNAGLHSAGVRFDPPPSRLLWRLPPIDIVTRTMAWALDSLPERILRPFIMSFLTTILNPSPAILKEGALLINRDGKRFTDELATPAFDIPKQPDGSAYFLLDQELMRKFSSSPWHISTAPGVAYAYLADYRRSRKDIYHEASTLRGLERRLGMTEGALEETVASYNNCSGEIYGAKGRQARRFGEGPYVALGPVRYYFTFADSGVAVDDHHRVIRGDGEPVPGLFAAGFIGMGGMLLEGLGHHLGWAFTSGRRAGRFAALRAVSADTTSEK